MEKEKTVILSPDWRNLFWWWLAGLLLLPLYGAGLALLWFAWRKWRSVRFVIEERHILCRYRDGDRRIDLASIDSARADQGVVERLFGIGSVHLGIGSGSVEMPGMKNPHRLASMITKAAASERGRLARKSPRPVPPDAPDPGTLDKMDYLTGLWQQGLISDEEFDREKRYFE